MGFAYYVNDGTTGQRVVRAKTRAGKTPDLTTAQALNADGTWKDASNNTTAEIVYGFDWDLITEAEAKQRFPAVK